jgi:hypothetical protein
MRLSISLCNAIITSFVALVYHSIQQYPMVYNTINSTTAKNQRIMRYTTTKPDTNVDDLGQILIVIYTLFALATGSRALYQIATRWHEAPLAFVLSTCAALIYLIACLGVRWRTPRAWWLTLIACSIELFGVLIVGTLTLLQPALFPRVTVWSEYGAGYLYIPLVLPFLGLAWLVWAKTRQAYHM